MKVAKCSPSRRSLWCFVYMREHLSVWMIYIKRKSEKSFRKHTRTPHVNRREHLHMAKWVWWWSHGGKSEAAHWLQSLLRSPHNTQHHVLLTRVRHEWVKVLENPEIWWKLGLLLEKTLQFSSIQIFLEELCILLGHHSPTWAIVKHTQLRLFHNMCFTTCM